jgi:hypothetical protein
MDALACASWAIHEDDAPSDWKTNQSRSNYLVQRIPQLSRFEHGELIVPVVREAGACI